MAEPYAAMALDEEQKATQAPDPLVNVPTTKPAFQVGPHIDQGTAEQAASDEAAQRGTFDGITQFPDSVKKSFTSGGNFGYQILQQIDRATESGPRDPDWANRQAEWLKANKDTIPEDQVWRYRATRNEDEANLQLADAQQQAKDIETLSRRGGISTFIAQGLAGIIDIDTIPAMALGGVAAEAKIGLMSTRLARLGVSGLVGAGTGAAAATGGYLSDPNSDWTVIPTVGLAGFAFGAAGGLLGGHGGARQAANEARVRTLDEFGETNAAGAPRSSENIHADVFDAADNYGATEAKQAESAAEELAVKAGPDVPPGAERAPASFSVDETSQQVAPDAVADAVPDRGPTLYHGTMNDFDNFDASKAGANSTEFNSSKGFFFSTNKEVAQSYATKKGLLVTKTGTVKEVTSTVKNPLIIDMQGKSYTEASNQMDLAIAQLGDKRGPYATNDGIIFKNLADSNDGKRTISDVHFIPNTENIQPVRPEVGRSTIGASQLGNSGPGISSIRSQQSVKIISNAQQRLGQTGILTDWNGGGFTKGGAIGKAADRFHTALNNIMPSDFARLMNSGSSVLQMLAYDVFENASGIVRNGRSGARIMEHYQRTMGAAFANFEDHFTEWASGKGMGFMERNWNTDARDQFNRLVANEMQARYYDGPAGQMGRQIEPSVAKAADALDLTFAREAEIMKGRVGEMPVKGAEKLTGKSGYMPQRWSGQNIQKLINAGKLHDDVVNAIAEGYTKTHPTMRLEDAKTYADAVVSFATHTNTGINTNLVGMLQADARVELEAILQRQGVPAAEIDRFIDRLKGLAEEKGAPGQTKGRLDIDLRGVASNGINLMDLVDTDFARFVPQRIRRSAGASALARKGIDSRTTWNAMVDAALSEQQANGPSIKSGTKITDRLRDQLDADKPVDREYMDNLYSYFAGGHIGQGMSPMYARLRKLTNLSLLNQLGLTQLAEFGPQIAAVGLESWFSHLSDGIKAQLGKATSQLNKDLEHFNIFVPEERLFRDDRMHELDRASPQTANGLLADVIHHGDRLLNKAQRIQGYTSGFYAVRNIQQRLTMTSGTDKLMQHFRNGGIISDDRLWDMGLGDRNILNSIKQYVDNGTVQFDAKGNTIAMNFDKWKPEDVEQFSMTMNAYTNQMVQRAMAGESSMLFHKDGLAGLFFHLKSFPLLAIEKQVLRNTRIMDTESAMQFMYGLVTAAAVYSARQTINGRTDRLTMSDIAKGAFGYSNFTGWIPMWSDPLAAMLGMDSLRMGGYTPLYGQNQILAIPAAFTTIDRQLQLPGAIKNTILNLGPSSSDLNALTAIPLIGNAYGFSLMFNALR
jgi:hypothetical protein